jgi:hypothetical protein
MSSDKLVASLCDLHHRLSYLHDDIISTGDDWTAEEVIDHIRDMIQEILYKTGHEKQLLLKYSPTV